MNVEIEVKLLIEAKTRLEALVLLAELLEVKDRNIEVFELFLLRGAPVAEVPEKTNEPHTQDFKDPY